MFRRLALVAAAAALSWAAFAHPSESAGPERAYVVRHGDTLWSIAEANYGGDPRAAVWRLRERNGLEGTTLLRPGRRLADRFDGCDAVVYGHTHVPQVARHGATWILNPGSPTERRTARMHAMLMLEVEGAEVRPELVRL